MNIIWPVWLLNYNFYAPMMWWHLVMHLFIRPSLLTSICPTLVIPFWLFHLTSILLATNLSYLHRCWIVSFSTHPYHLNPFWPWSNFGLKLIQMSQLLGWPILTFHLTSMLLATKLWYLHGCWIWSFSTHLCHLTPSWPWPNFGLRLIQMSQLLG